MGIDFDADFEKILAGFDSALGTTPDERRGICTRCGQELLPESDAYWGLDVRGNYCCYPCRRRDGIE